MAGFEGWGGASGGVEERVAGFDGVGAVVEDEGFGGEGCCWRFGGFLAGHLSYGFDVDFDFMVCYWV